MRLCRKFLQAHLNQVLLHGSALELSLQPALAANIAAKGRCLANRPYCCCGQTHWQPRWALAIGLQLSRRYRPRETPTTVQVPGPRVEANLAAEFGRAPATFPQPTSPARQACHRRLDEQNLQLRLYRREKRLRARQATQALPTVPPLERTVATDSQLMAKTRERKNPTNPSAK